MSGPVDERVQAACALLCSALAAVVATNRPLTALRYSAPSANGIHCNAGHPTVIQGPMSFGTLEENTPYTMHHLRPRRDVIKIYRQENNDSLLVPFRHILILPINHFFNPSSNALPCRRSGPPASFNTSPLPEPPAPRLHLRVIARLGLITLTIPLRRKKKKKKRYVPPSSKFHS